MNAALDAWLTGLGPDLGTTLVLCAAFVVGVAIGIERGIIVQSTVYATDHTIVVDALKDLGPRYRAIGVIDDTVSDAELLRLVQNYLDGRTPEDVLLMAQQINARENPGAQPPAPSLPVVPLEPPSF